MRPLIAALSALLLASPLAAQQVGRPRRAPLLGAVQPFRGEVNAYHPYRVTAPYDGRIESILVSPNQWVTKNEVLALLASTELAALLDTSNTTPQDILEKRWQNVFKPTEVHCPYEVCTVLSLHASSKAKMTTGDLILVLAESYSLEAEVRPPAADEIHPGQIVDVWTSSDPKHRQKARVIDVRGRRSSGQVHASFLLPANLEHVKPGDTLEGEIPLNKREQLLLVPAGSVTNYQGRTFLNIEVQTGLNNGREVEILSGLTENQTFLVPAGVAYQEPIPGKKPAQPNEEDEE